MSMLLYYSLTFFIFKIISQDTSSAYQDGDSVFYADIKKMELCPNCSKNCDQNYKAEFKLHSQWKNGHYVRYFSGKLHIEETFEMKNNKLVAYKCHHNEHNCEMFLSFNHDAKPFCELAKQKNQWWTPVIDAVQPQTWKKTCPVFYEGIMYINNATINADLFQKVYPVLLNHYWIFHTFIENIRNKKLLCIVVGTTVKKYTYRRRGNKEH